MFILNMNYENRLKRYVSKNVRMTFGKGCEGHSMEFNKPYEMAVDITDCQRLP